MWLWLAIAPLPCADPAALEARARAAESRPAQVELAEALRAPALFEGELDAEARAERAVAYCGLLAQPKSSVTVDRPRLSEILSRPEFEGARVRNSEAWQQLLQRLRDWFFGLLETSGVSRFSAFTRVAVLALGLAAAIAAALRLAHALSGRSSRRARNPLGSSPDPLKLDDPREHLARAGRLSDPRERLREALLALLSTLERARLARPDRVKTNRELAAELPTRGAPPELTRQVGGLLDRYDREFYSLRPVPEEEAERFLGEVSTIHAQLSNEPGR